MPNAFTPNGDGLNDIIRPVCAGIKTLKYFTVFNRYGQIVFTTTTQGEGWNGPFMGRQQSSGTFTWIAAAIDYQDNIVSVEGAERNEGSNFIRNLQTHYMGRQPPIICVIPVVTAQNEFVSQEVTNPHS